ncbi:hypothetical protein ABPG72_013152 [Tetrahymena utriculariae]
MKKPRAQPKKDNQKDNQSITSQASKQYGQLPKFVNNFLKNDPDPEHRFNKHFSQKYNDSLPLIKQIQYEKEQVNTPFINAQKSLRFIVEQELRNGKNQSDSNLAGQSLKRNQTKASIVMKTNHYLNTIKDTERSFQTSSIYEGQDINYEPFLIDLIKLSELEEKLLWIVDFAFKGDEVGYPSFQSYWEILFELKLEKLHTLFSNPEWKENIDFALLLNISSIAFFQCVSLKLHENPMLIQTSLFSKVLSDMRNILEQIYQTLLILMSQILGKVPQENRSNIWYQSIEKTIKLKKIRNIKKDDLFDIKKNNQLVESYLKSVLREFQKQFLLENTEIERIKPIFSVISFCLRERNNIQLTKLRENIINGTFLSIRQQNQHEDSIMKTIYHPLEPAQPFSPIDLIGLPPGEEPVLDIPFLPPRNQQEIKEKPYTLVLDLDETLGHYDQDKQSFLQRPGLNEFLESIHNYYELVIFTAGLKDYADSIIPTFDQKGLISHRLYRQHCNLQGLVHIKDLNNLGRDLSKTIILDNNQYNFQYQQENAIFVTTWYSDMSDTELFDLKKVLIRLAESNPTDVRWALQKYRDHIIRQISNGVKNPFHAL